MIIIAWSLTDPHRQQPKEPFQKTERRDWAETVLDNPELLLMYAQSSGDVSTFHTPLFISLGSLLLIVPCRPSQQRVTSSRKSCAAWTSMMTTTPLSLAVAEASITSSRSNTNSSGSTESHGLIIVVVAAADRGVGGGEALGLFSLYDRASDQAVTNHDNYEGSYSDSTCCGILSSY